MPINTSINGGPPPAPVMPGWIARWDEFLRSRAAIPALSVVLLAPCYWQPRIQAGDLSSHIYNSWLSQLAESGSVPGLAVAAQTTNVLFDLILGALFRLAGAGAAQRLSVGLAALIFIWGAFAFISAVGERRAWNVLPCIAMLAYGWVFHMGFFNFYLATGLCLWALALAWHPERWRVAGALVLFAVAWTAHALPVVWSLVLWGYVFLARRWALRWRGLLTLGVLASAAAARLVLMTHFSGRWFYSQVIRITGADQVWVFDAKYCVILLGLLFFLGALFLDLTHAWGARRVLSSIPFHLALISAGIPSILPSSVAIPGRLHALTYISERMSLCAGICACALLAAARPRAFERCAMVAVALTFFLFLYRDERLLNAFEDRVDAAVAGIQPASRVVNLVNDPDLRVNALTHMVDRACVGRCFSFANYEPASAAFRLRVLADNPYVVRTSADSWALETGTYLVKPSDVPVYGLDMEESGKIVVRELKAGALCGGAYWRVLPELIPIS
jgi:hypothetical protein